MNYNIFIFKKSCKLYVNILVIFMPIKCSRIGIVIIIGMPLAGAGFNTCQRRGGELNFII